MKRLCCNNLLLVFFFLLTVSNTAYGDKSAIAYLGEKISYPMVGVHDYIIVDPKKTNIYTHGFDLYKYKIYPKISLNQANIAQAPQTLKTLRSMGYQNFFFDFNEDISIESVRGFFSSFKSEKNGVIVHIDNKKILGAIADRVDAFVLYNISQAKDLDEELHFYKSYGKDLIDLETNKLVDIQQLKKLNLIPYITTPSMDIYGQSTKKVVKREVLTLIDESKHDRIVSSAHQYGGLALEYWGYYQQLYDVRQGLPDPDTLTQYAGVIIWLSVSYKNPAELVSWFQEVKAKKIPIVFAYGFGFNGSSDLLQQLEIQSYDGKADTIKTIVHKDKMMDYEVKVPKLQENYYLKAPKNSKKLLTYQDSEGLTSTTAAITPWGGYAMDTSFFVEVDEENLWAINPFEFFKEALRLEELPVPDTTTQNGSRLFFTHIDGDGIMNGVEFNPELVSGDIIYSEILKKYKVPHSVSIIGAEIMKNGLYPKLSDRLLEITKKMYALENVEPATHTFTHPFFWGEIKNDTLKKEYRLQPKGYHFSMQYEINGTLNFINEQLLPKNKSKEAKTVFWSGDCNPRENALEYISKNKILNINGGYTTINNGSPWLTSVSPLGLIRDEYYQIYTGAQNENVFTNDWLGPFWGFKKVVQTFKLTNSPKRLKPIDIYYHLYSGSKKASLNALRYIFDWVLSQRDIMPIFTSEYILKAMDYYTVSIAKQENGSWLYAGMRDLKTLRIEQKDAGVDLQSSPTVLGVKHFEDHTYLSLDNHLDHQIKATKHQTTTQPYLISANGKVVAYEKGDHTYHYEFDGNVALQTTFYLPKGCEIISDPLANHQNDLNNTLTLSYKSEKKATIDVRCQH